MRPRGQHHTIFTRALWAKWLARLNEGPDLHLKAGIQEFRALLSRHDRKHR